MFYLLFFYEGGGIVMFNTTFNNIVAWILLMEEAEKNHWPAASHWQTMTIMLYDYTSPWWVFELKTLVVIGNGCTGSCKSNNHTIINTTFNLQ